MATRNIAAIDLGAESGRTILARFDGQRLELRETHRFPNLPVDILGTLYWDLLGLWREIKLGLGKTASGRDQRIDLIGIDTWGVDFGFLDSAGRLLGNPVHYRDRRTDGILEHAFARVPREEIYRRTGLQFLKFNSLLQLLAIQREAGATPFEGAHRLLFIPDLFNYFLTGHAVTEPTIASTSQFLDPLTQEWASELLERFELPTAFLPPIVPTGSLLGPLTAPLVEETGASGARVVVSAGHDTAAAVAAAPAQGTDWCYISSGTWSLMGTELDRPLITPQALADNFTNEAGVCRTVRFLKNIMGLWLVQECRRGLERRGRALDYAALVRAAAEAPPFGPIVHPDDESFMKPADMPTAIRDFCVRTGQSPPADEGSLVRCCLESLALCYRRTLRRIEANVGRPMRGIHIVGGGSQNELLCQFTADCCQVEVLAGPVEATAMGNALVQLLGIGELGSLEEVRSVVRASSPTARYRPGPSEGWDEAYRRFESFFRDV